MELICISDLHGRSSEIKQMKEQIKNADLVILAGDITNFGHKEKAKAIVNEILQLNKDLLAVPGNCDLHDVAGLLEELEVSIHGNGCTLKGIGFFGVGGSNSTPFNTPQEYSEGELERFLNEGYEKIKEQEMKVMISHPPPYNTKLDKTKAGLHVGSKKVREFIEKTRPNLVLCGHIHEAKGHDKIANSIIINPGPLHMGFVRINLGKEIDFGFVRF
jgi:hypothetical protein